MGAHYPGHRKKARRDNQLLKALEAKQQKHAGPQMRHPVLWSKETEDLTLCPLDGSKLLRREGLDDPETIKTRLEEYKERTFPLVDYFKEEIIIINEIKGEQTVEKVFQDMLKAIEK